MNKAVEFYFDLGSPASYLAYTQLPDICLRANAQLHYKPILLGAVFQLTGNASPAMIPAKGRYIAEDLARFAKRYGVAMRFSRFFPINTMTMMRMLLAVQLREPQQFDALLRVLFEGIWLNNQNLGDEQVLGQVLTEAGFDVSKLLAYTAQPEIKGALKKATELAVERGVFGAPTCFVDDQMFFGQDRLDFIESALGF